MELRVHDIAIKATLLRGVFGAKRASLRMFAMLSTTYINIGISVKARLCPSATCPIRKERGALSLYDIYLSSHFIAHSVRGEGHASMPLLRCKLRKEKRMRFLGW